MAKILTFSETLRCLKRKIGESLVMLDQNINEKDANNMMLNIDHIGIVVKSLNKAINDWNMFFGYTQYTQKVENTSQKVM